MLNLRNIQPINLEEKVVLEDSLDGFEKVCLKW